MEATDAVLAGLLRRLIADAATETTVADLGLQITSLGNMFWIEAAEDLTDEEVALITTLLPASAIHDLRR